MAIPDYQSVMLPLLKFAEDEKEHSIREAIEYISGLFNLSEEEKRELLPSGQQAVIDNRVGWARTYLKKAGLLESTKRGYFRITARGLGVLNQNPSEINMQYLMQFPEFEEFRTLRREVTGPSEEDLHSSTPLEVLESGYQDLRSDLAQNLLNLVKSCSPEFFENLVVELLLRMGYGGSRRDAGEAIGRRGDGGIDGIIKEDRLGLDVIYIQAKRWEGVVGENVLRDFVGALTGKGATKGILITTSDFAQTARDYVSRLANFKIALVNGEQLAQLMIDNDIGVSKEATYEIKKIDSDYFIEE